MYSSFSPNLQYKQGELKHIELKGFHVLVWNSSDKYKPNLALFSVC